MHVKTPVIACSQVKAIAKEVYGTMVGLAKALPMYVWLIALPQLCSRLTHPHPDTATLTRNIITRVFMAYPQQVRFDTITQRRAQDF